MRFRLPSLLAGLLVCVLTPAAGAAPPPTTLFTGATTLLISRSYSGGMPNGPSGAGDISHDDRRGSIAVFQSDASDIVRHDPNQHTDVFLVHRHKPYGNLGTLWHAGSNRLVSRGLGGAPANGRSYAPVVDGSTKHRPRCIAFISEASNLVRGDTNGVADAFVYSLRTHRIRRVSVSSGGAQANGPTYEVAVDGDCGRVAFTSSATNLALTRTHRRAWKRGVSAPVAPGHRQVYVRFLARGGLDRGFRGMTALASVSDTRQPGNADSFGPAFARSGKVLGFTSVATNLAPADLSAGPDVYVREMPRKFVHLGHGRGVQTLATHTRLVSDGGGLSSSPSLSSSGRYVAYSTGASVPQVVRADLATAAAAAPTLVSKTQTDPGNAPSVRPSISDAGHFVAFESAATNLRMFPRFASDPNGVTDVYLGVIGYGSSSAESLESDNRFASAPSAAPRISARGNYIVFQSADQRMDARIPNPGMQQVYLRWLLPKVD
jgi:hypothetical protein